jgi:hypothetical protein
MVFEFEYPYYFVLAGVQNAKSVNGAPVSAIIKNDGAKWPPKLQWHTCSYCADSCGNEHLTCVTLEAPDRSTIYHFAFCRQSHTLVPLTPGTAAHYPTMMPTNDSVRGVTQLSGGRGALGNGYGDFELPERWFRKATRTKQDGSGSQGQAVGSETNRTSTAPGSGG